MGRFQTIRDIVARRRNKLRYGLESIGLGGSNHYPIEEDLAPIGVHALGFYKEKPEPIVYTPSVETKFFLPKHIYQEMLCYARGVQSEISGFGKTRVELVTLNKGKKDEKKERVIHVEEVMIFKQECTGGHTELSGDDLTQFYLEIVNRKENPKRWNLWWHSHFDFGTFFSSIDTDTLKKLSANSRAYGICINQFGEMSATYYSRGKEVQEKVKVVMQEDIDPEIKKKCEEEIKLKVKIRRQRYVTDYSPAIYSAGRNHQNFCD